MLTQNTPPVLTQNTPNLPAIEMKKIVPHISPWNDGPMGSINAS